MFLLFKSYSHLAGEESQNSVIYSAAVGAGSARPTQRSVSSAPTIRVHKPLKTVPLAQEGQSSCFFVLTLPFVGGFQDE